MLNKEDNIILLLLKEIKELCAEIRSVLDVLADDASTVEYVDSDPEEEEEPKSGPVRKAPCLPTVPKSN